MTVTATMLSDGAIKLIKLNILIGLTVDYRFNRNAGDQKCKASFQLRGVTSAFRKKMSIALFGRD